MHFFNGLMIVLFVLALTGNLHVSLPGPIMFVVGVIFWGLVALTALMFGVLFLEWAYEKIKKMAVFAQPLEKVKLAKRRLFLFFLL